MMSSQPTANQYIRTALPQASSVRTIAVTSGHTGVGKTNFVANIAIELVKRRRTVTVLNTDAGARQADTILGIERSVSLQDLVRRKITVPQLICQSPYGVQYIAGQEGLEELASTSPEGIIQELENIESETNFLLIDAPAGIGDNLMQILAAASEIVVITVPESNAVVDTYATIKVLHKYSPVKPILIVVNSVMNIREGEDVFNQLSGISMRFLNRQLTYLGAIPKDYALEKAFLARQPVVNYAPEVPSSRSFHVIANNLYSNIPQSTKPTGSFWRLVGHPELA